MVATAVDDVYLYVTLKGPDGAVMASALSTLPSSAVETSYPYDNDGDVLFMPKFDMHTDMYVLNNFNVDTTTPLTLTNTLNTNTDVSNVFYSMDIAGYDVDSYTGLELHEDYPFLFKETTTSLRYLYLVCMESIRYSIHYSST